MNGGGGALTPLATTFAPFPSLHCEFDEILKRFASIDINFSENLTIPVKYEPYWCHQQVTVHRIFKDQMAIKFILPIFLTTVNMMRDLQSMALMTLQ